MTTQESPAADPYSWLEDIDGARALTWVKAQNQTSRQRLEAEPGFAALNARLLSIYNSRDTIPFVGGRGGFYYNFWQDDRNVRGVWRRTTPEEYAKAEPAWDVLLDLDALGAAEHESYVWKGARCLYPDFERCLITLSRGGGDAAVVREFDIATRRFVSDGFQLPESKGYLEWIDRDTVFVGGDFGPGSMTTSGYARIAKIWRRGTPLSSASIVLEGQAGDVAVRASRERGWVDGKVVFHDFVTRAVSFFKNEVYLYRDGRLERLAIPEDAELDTFADQLLIVLRSDWTVTSAGVAKTWPQGALLAIDLETFQKGGRDFTMLYEPGPRKSLAGMASLKSALIVDELDELRPRLYRWKLQDSVWSRTELPVGTSGSVSVLPVDADAGDAYFLVESDPLTPMRLAFTTTTPAAAVTLKRQPAFFDAAGMNISQHEATSKDGERIPYVQISPPGFVADGTRPTILYGYGGFEVSLLPAGYSATQGAAWLEKGGVMVIAGIRGGGEFGPAWHQAAMAEHKRVSYDDFIAVAEDLVARRVTAPRHLGIQGGSNGGLLVGAVMVEHPTLFGAVVCEVPLLDMRRFNHLLAGASWMEEYGDPDDPKQWAWISKYSPYQNVKAHVRYPPILFQTSTRDDRVHPAHARKMAARMEAFGNRVLYYENTEGGHAGAADPIQEAYMSAQAYTFFDRELR